MRKLIFLIIISLFMNFSYAETLQNIVYVEKIAKEFEKKMTSKPLEVAKFITTLKKKNQDFLKNKGQYDLTSFIKTLSYIDYKNFDMKKCKSYRRTIIVRSSNPKEELSSKNVDVYTYHALKILSKVCKDPRIIQFKNDKK